MKAKHEEVPKLPYRKELLEEIKKENYRQILISQINLRLFEREKLKNPNAQIMTPLGAQPIEKEIAKAKVGLTQLLTGMEMIDEELKQYEGKNK